MSDWRDEASCKGVDVSIFVPQEGRGGPTTGRSVYAKARKFCSNCKVQSHCLFFAIENNMEFGMFGGLTPRERRKLRRQYLDGMLQKTAE